MTGNHKFGICYEIWICLLLVIATLAVYWQVRGHDFVNYDDNVYVSENYNINKGLNAKNISWAFTTGYASNWHPLTWLSHMVDIELYGINPGAHHLSSVIFHIANSLLLFLVLRRMTGNLWSSAFVAALFALHPLHVESVAWVSERKDVLSTFFWILTMGAYALYAENPKWHSYLITLLFFVLGLMSKPMVITLPFVLLLLDFWPLGRIWELGIRTPSQGGILEEPISETRTPQRGNFEEPISETISNFKFRISSFEFLLLEKIPFFIFVAASGVVTFFVQQKGGAVASVEKYSLGIRIGNALISYASYIGKMIWPSDLSGFYPHPGTDLSLWQAACAGLLLICVSAAVIRTVKIYPYLIVGWLWYLGTLIPVIGLVQVGAQAMADRYTYVPLIGLFIMIGWGIPDLLRKWPGAKQLEKHSVFFVLPMSVLLILTTLSWMQTGYWKNSLTFFKHMLDVSPDSSKARDGIGLALANRGKTAEAILHYREALRIRPDYSIAHNNLGQALLIQGHIQEAITHFEAALKAKQIRAKAHNNMGTAMAMQGRTAEAMKHFQKAADIRPDHANAYYNIAKLLKNQGKIPEAVQHLQKALSVNPRFADAHYNLANILTGQGKKQEAIAHFQQVLLLKPEDAETHARLGLMLLEQRKSGEAAAHLWKSLQISPGNADAHNHLGVALFHEGNIRAAKFHFQKVLQINPDHAGAAGNLRKIRDKRQKKRRPPRF